MGSSLSKYDGDQEEFWRLGGQGSNPYTKDPRLVPPSWRSRVKASREKDLQRCEDSLAEYQEETKKLLRSIRRAKKDNTVLKKARRLVELENLQQHQEINIFELRKMLELD